MKKSINTKFFTFVFACLLFPLFGCEKDDDSTPEPKMPQGPVWNPMEEGGALSGNVNGQMTVYPDIEIRLYPLDEQVGIIGIDTVQNDVHRMRIIVPRDSVTGAYESGDPGFYADYEIIPGLDEDESYKLNQDKESEINIESYELVKTSGETNFYRVRGTFSLSGRRSLSTEVVDVQNGVFDFTYEY